MSRRTRIPAQRHGIRETLADARDAFARVTSHSPSRFAIGVFVGLITIFTVLLSLPFAAADGVTTRFVDALFTAVSVICVTGLSTVDMATHWSPAGHTVIFLGVQIGAVGVLTVASILGMLVSRKLGLRARLLAASDTNSMRAHHGPVAEGQAIRLGEIGSLLATVAVSLVVIEAVVAVLLFPRMLMDGIPLWDAIWNSIYYAAMAFTNTGFTPNADGLGTFATDYWFLGILMVAVFFGSLGFPVIFALRKRGLRFRSWPLHTKLTVITTLVLLVLGAIVLVSLEYLNPLTFGSMNAADTAFQSVFLSMMTRSGGFTTVPISDLNNSSLLIMDMLMFIGGGSASTAGGIKVTTLAVLFLAAFAEAKGRRDLEAFGRRIPGEVVRVALSVVFWAASIVAAASVILLHITKAPLDHVLFDVISAFGTVGLSTGLTETLPDEGKYVIAATMFLGRVGTVTLATAVAATQNSQLFRRPEERPLVG
ncbi:TrkH family potassium uptake protein [Mycetocola reblochoni]|uniref:Potassium uptake protein, integral membrane component, KtrB n=2 Tax=Mycetocola reblochoni TaxID=331618 RepID=A0A1R4IWS8_9MICO|nr:potassium transporter TrkG [Mycetocola reblochoni]RLP70943.1 TrkH family potassium uptake protein [Mycetocola reblochoni]SJN24320.1 Potassium uptake protein, integral membrane component, KtrB [Mycetocola reblochoni REB411]